MLEPISMLVVVHGRVQGVYYRATVERWARELGITGWVKNEPDGSVSALIQHIHQGKLDELVERMWQGPPRAVVTELHTVQRPGELAYSEFMIRNDHPHD